MKLTIFNELDFLPALRAFFAELQVPIASLTDAPIPAREILENSYKDMESFRLIDDVYFLGMVDDAAFKGGKSLAIDKIKSDYDGILIFGITLRGCDDSLLPTRSQLAEISRAFNREFCYTPVVVVFKYGEYLAFANTERLKYKDNREGEKAGKVTLLRDIDIRQPHTGHERILADLKIPTVGKDRVDSFEKLYKYWRKVLDVNLLNKKFYQEVSAWYFHACKQVVFPKDAKDNQESLIRLITRLMFVWFLKEKGLVPDALFDHEDMRSLLKSLEPQESTYYKAILQNLFFATLNTEKDRAFIKRSGSQSHHYMVHNVFRYESYFQEPDQVIDRYFAGIPFLNGGLFECLDIPPQKNKAEPEIRIDGFSDNSKNSLSVPNELFFGNFQDVDLNADFGTSRKKYQVRGLVEIFKSYKFTIAENTPFEEDVALDPELLGQVFENLLAAYNPETQTTARKQTGSFYTPREIVNYMVDESLIAYLKNYLPSPPAPLPQGEEGKKQEESQSLTPPSPQGEGGRGDEGRLRHLLSYTDEPHQFTDAEVERLIQALDNCKILDPACGSGAFPMGILQKMVHILSKLDRHNERWKHQQKEREILPVLEDLRQAQKISYEQAREAAVRQLEERLGQIEDDFANNEKDYPRKLFLIENCIYGVDIQPIALQIAKLRCFISLIVEQKVDNNQPNRGILPLPNLETKFVAANSLIRFSDQLNLRSNEVIATEQELKEVQKKHFTARSKATKDKYRERDQELRKAIGDLLKATGLEVALADSLATWNPYNQNTSADFFDPEWMFGIADGFDIVIGNPPYVRQEQIKEFKPILQKQFDCYTGVADLFVYFFERGYQLLNTGGVLSYICSNKYFRSGYGEKLRDFLGKNTTIQQLIDFGDTDVFTAIAYPSIILFSKEKASKDAKLKALSWQQTEALNQFPSVFDAQNFLMPQSALKADGWRLENTQVLDLLAKLRNAGKPLGEYVNGKFYYGIKTGFNEAFVIDRATRDKLIAEHSSSAEIIKPFLRGRDVKRWRMEYQDLYLIFTKKGIDIKKYPAIENYLSQYKNRLEIRAGDSKWFELQASPAEVNRFERRKIVYPDIASSCEFAFDNNSIFPDCTLFFIPSESEYLLGFLNSSIIQFFISQIFPAIRGNFRRFKSIYVSQIPIPTATEAEQKTIETLVQKCLEAKGQNVGQWEQEIDEIVARLYGLSDLDRT
ncbi:Modification methylase BstVI [Planktothrix agardhii]|jgi:adenine-specific DNA-methyltransferase|uniref:Eco57I restriction-modification methylase domain-containing protein n=1 Tax=Planktothrix agardhii TaxID=1160 RepID=UPI001A25B015|nr:TaqI-like C-terminal specificity domain-containing protein [Planktothrix agardhii]MBG0747557.1 Eco57I restriction-modification methylase domain-containing protein [Planktothrix agardhii KL2]MCF3576399.1 BREX-1 system adenine-specific DNA-methyltransferase PglX [Planktothrix agardhii 1812]MCF3579775.1 BREX-1 system adenine-specific DNA-methyltransferase PglX [Planktothrix agardhii 1811]MCF3590559.1 BREX-1 system adenine-specific DNA-methyltransferase PglX [Planktothrix agardhii 1029]MCF36199